LKSSWHDDRKKKILESLYRFLKLIYSESKKIDDKQSYIIQQIYKGEILKSLSAIILALKDIKDIKNFEVHITPVVNSLMKLVSQDQFINSNFLTLMHGDLNLRNIMIGLEEDDSVNLKLIDIDKLTLDGDYAYDVGELIVDLDIQVGKVYSRYVEQKFEDFAKEESDESFTSRLTIGKINSLLKLAKINVNKGEFEKCIELFNKINEELLPMLSK
jgi:tetratricopeptide (TPR) repeat protein